MVPKELNQFKFIQINRLIKICFHHCFGQLKFSNKIRLNMAYRSSRKKKEYAVIRLTESCNFACSICYLDGLIYSDNKNTQKKTTLQETKDKIRLFHIKGYDAIRFTGGEPTLVNGLPELISYAKSVGFKDIKISSNGLKISEKNYCKNLSLAGLTEASIPIHGNNAKEHDKITKLKGSYKKALKAIKYLVKYGISVEPTITINSLDYMNLNKILDRLSRLNIKRVSFFYVLPIGRAVHNKWTIIPYDISSDYLNLTLRYAKRRKIDFNVMDVPHCYVSKEFHESLFSQFIWEVNRTFKLNECIQCRYYHKCIGFDIGYIHLIGEDNIKKEVKARILL
jgi:MoaA/NifB/PqqE/SkfB family radical SAM enzyme